MQIPKDQIVSMIESRLGGDQAQQAAQQLPDQVDHEQHAGVLSQFGIDPQELSSQFGGGGQAGQFGGQGGPGDQFGGQGGQSGEQGGEFGGQVDQGGEFGGQGNQLGDQDGEFGGQGNQLGDQAGQSSEQSY